MPWSCFCLCLLRSWPAARPWPIKISRAEILLLTSSCVAGESLGQTFVAQHGGLSGLEIWLESAQPSDGWIRLHLRSDPQATTDLAVAELPLATVTTPGFYRFSFPPVPDSHNRDFYAFLDIEGAGAVQVGAERRKQLFERRTLPRSSIVGCSVGLSPAVRTRLGWAGACTGLAVRFRVAGDRGPVLDCARLDALALE